MNTRSGIAALVLLSASLSAAELDQLTVLYVGDPDSPRARDFTGFLELNVAKVGTAPRAAFDSKQAVNFDVVVLDWPQSGSTVGAWTQGSPLGERANWSKPTVLLGSAGLNLAVVWKVRGGSG